MLMTGLKSKFCVNCGKEKVELIDALCAECYFENNEIKLPNKIELIICKRCNTLRWQGMWMEGYSPETFFRQQMVAKLKIPEAAELKKVEVLKFGEESEVLVKINILGKHFEKIFIVEVNTIDNICPNCNRLSARTHLGIVQLRSKGNVDSFLNKVLKYTQKYQSKMLKVIDQKNGVDLYFIDKESPRHLASELKNELDCKAKETYEEYGWDQTKNKPRTRVVISVQEVF